MLRTAAILLMPATLGIVGGCSKPDSPESSVAPAQTEAPAVQADARPGQADAMVGVETFRATGNEPGWRLDIGPSEMVLLTDLGQTRTVAATAPPQAMNGVKQYTARTDGGEIVVSIADELCRDSMTGMPYPNTVTVVFEGTSLAGCGGDPASLPHGSEWIIDDIAGASVVKGSRVSLEFGPEGHVSGNSSCNRYTTQYTLSGEGLTIAKGAGTRMMCDPPLMEQERTFLDALSTVNAFDLAADGALVLTTADGRTIRARRGEV